MKAMILAAGLGTRFRPYSEFAPKPTFPFLNIPFLHYSAFFAEKFGCTDLIVNTHHLPSKIEAVAKQTGFKNEHLTFSHESEILGNGGGVGQVRDLLKSETFLVLNADTVAVPSSDEVFARALSQHKESRPLATLMVMPHSEAGEYYGGVWIDKDQRIHGMGRSNPAPHLNLTPYHFFGVRIFEPEIFKILGPQKSDIFVDILNPAIKQGARVEAFIDQSIFFDGGYLDGFLADSKKALELFPDSSFLQQVARRHWSDFHQRADWRCGVDYSGPNDFYQADHRLFGKNVTVDKTVQIEGLCILGEGVKIESGVKLKNVVVGPSVYLRANSTHENDLLLK